MKDLLVVMNARDIEPCMQSLRELPIDKAYLKGFTERQIADVAFNAVMTDDYDWIWCVSDDVIARPEHLMALRQARRDGHPVVTGYSQRSHTEFVVNLTDKPLHQDYPAAESYSFRHFRDVVSYPLRVLPTWFAGMSMTGMSMEMWRRFRFDCYGDPGYASDFNLSWRLQQAGIPIVGCRDAFLYHWRHNWVNTSDPRDESPVIGAKQIVLEPRLSWGGIVESPEHIVIV